MQFTGTELTRSRSIYTQNTNFGWAMDCYVNNTTGRYEFGVSGTAGSLAFTLESGRILAGTTFLHSYAANERFYLECQVTTSTYNVIKDEVPLVMGAGKVSGDYSNLYFSRAEPTLFADFNFHASGQNLPNVAIDDVGYLLTTGQNAVTGQYLNNGSYPVRVFDSEAFYAQGLDFGALAGTVAQQGSGQFAFTGDFSSLNFANPILVDFATNYNNARVAFTIIDARSQISFVYLQPTTFDFNDGGVLARNVLFNNYSGGFQVDSFPAQITFALDYVSGSGLFVDGDSYTTTGYGSFAESGVLTGYAETITGNIVISQFEWATGAVTGVFSGIGTGAATGLGYTGLGSGGFTGLYSGTIHNGSGTLLLGGSVNVGQPIGVMASVGDITFATGLLTLGTGLVKFSIYSGNTQMSSLTCIYGSGSPTLVTGGLTGSIAWSSGEDILWGISGMRQNFGITGYVSNRMLYLSTTGFGAAANACTIAAKNAAIYPFTTFAGGTASTVANGQIDLSNPLYTSSFNDLTIAGYGSNILRCQFRPRHTLFQNDVFVRYEDSLYRCFYTTAATLASGINTMNGEITATAVGNKVYLSYAENGVVGNDTEIYYADSLLSQPSIGITGTIGNMIGGGVSTKATGYVEILPIPENKTGIMWIYGFFGAYNSTTEFDANFNRFGGAIANSSSFPRLQTGYYGNASDLAFALSGSVIGSVFFNGQASGGNALFTRSNFAGTGGNVNYFGSGLLSISLTGGDIRNVGLPVVSVGIASGTAPTTLVTGSGDYAAVISQSGTLFYKTFLNTWDLYTGLSVLNMASAKHVGSVTDTNFVATGTFPPNSQLSFQIIHHLLNSSPDGAIFSVSGNRVLNGINQNLSQP